jgi:hypothetical protein
VSHEETDFGEALGHAAFFGRPFMELNRSDFTCLWHISWPTLLSHLLFYLSITCRLEIGDGYELGITMDCGE